MFNEELNNEVEFFKEKGFGKTLNFKGKACLLVIDIIKGFTDPSLPMGSDLTKEISNINSFLAFSRKKDIPVVFTTISYDNSNLSDNGVWHEKMQGLNTLTSNTINVELDDRLDYEKGDSILVKKYASAFFGTDLSSRLTANQIETVIIVGATTSGCVRATAVDAIQYGFRPLVLSDCCGDRSKTAHVQSIFDISQKYGDILTLKEVLTSESDFIFN